jgi:hypothetical protein
MQRAWLEFDTGYWLLLTDGRNQGGGAVRTWADKSAALSELACEGWTVSGACRRWRSQVDSNRRFRGYALARTIQ